NLHYTQTLNSQTKLSGRVFGWCALRSAKMKCPIDKSTLTAHKKGNLEIEYCQQCSGFSVRLEQDAAKKLEDQLTGHFSSPQTKNSKVGLSSPHTNSSMKSFKYRGVLLDYCSESHSIWFDKGEYSKIFASSTQTEKTVKKESSDGGWSVLDIVAAPIDIIDISGSILDTLGDIVSDITSGIDL
ncbi:MAG: hypothetical protein ACSHX2_15300, partial [Rubritalea sp.]